MTSLYDEHINEWLSEALAWLEEIDRMDDYKILKFAPQTESIAITLWDHVCRRNTVADFGVPLYLDPAGCAQRLEQVWKIHRRLTT